MKPNLKEMRRRAGYDRAKDFAEHIGMSYSTYSAYESGARTLNVGTAWELADALGCTLDELVGRETPPAKPEYAFINLTTGEVKRIDS